MSSYLTRQVRSAVIGMFTALTALLAVGPLASTLITPGPSRPTGVALPAAPSAAAGRPAPTASSGQPAPTALSRSVPVRISIPAIDATSSLVSLGLTPDRTLEVPPVEDPMQAGWYSLGPTPGEVGASVIAGHVDGNHEPGIFYELYKLKRGDQILIGRQDGTTARFEVYGMAQVDKNDFPSDLVYAATTRPELRLITCGGSFNYRSGNYTDTERRTPNAERRTPNAERRTPNAVPRLAASEITDRIQRGGPAHRRVASSEPVRPRPPGHDPAVQQRAQRRESRSARYASTACRNATGCSTHG